jgi:hypothetical protein
LNDLIRVRDREWKIGHAIAHALGERAHLLSRNIGRLRLHVDLNVSDAARETVRNPAHVVPVGCGLRRRRRRLRLVSADAH